MASASATELPGRLSCLLLSLSDRKLLVPITVIAEVINSTEALQVAETGGPVYGWFHWRGQRLPLLSYEACVGASRPPLGGGYRIAVINAISAAAGTGFYGLLLQEMPHSIQVSGEHDLSEGDDDWIYLKANVGEVSAQVPRLEKVEQLVAGLAG